VIWETDAQFKARLRRLRWAKEMAERRKAQRAAEIRDAHAQLDAEAAEYSAFVEWANAEAERDPMRINPFEP
jgi:hypothetical protein